MTTPSPGTLIFILLFFSGLLFSQVKTKADHAFRNGDFDLAIQLYSEYPELNNDALALLNSGRAYLETGLYLKATEHLKRSLSISDDNKDLYWFLALSQQRHGLYNDALQNFKNYIKSEGEKATYSAAALREIKNILSFSRIESNRQKTKILVQNFESANSTSNDIHPVQSRIFGNSYYHSFKSSGNEYSVVLNFIDNEGKWTRTVSDTSLYNTADISLIQDIDGSGKSMLLLESNSSQAKTQPVFITMDDSGIERRIPLTGKLFEGAIDFQIVNYNTLAFSRNKPESEDLEILLLQYDKGLWIPLNDQVKRINSGFNERSPCFSPDLNSVFFSSDRPYGSGGYDLYFMDFSLADSKPEPLPIPVNSTADELHFRIDATGRNAIFSSNRKGGKGAFDIYFAYLDRDYKFIGRDTLDFIYSILPTSQKNDSLHENIEEPNSISPELTLTEEQLAQLYNIFYTDSFDLLDDVNRLKLKKIKTLTHSQQYTLHLIAHTDHLEPGLPEYAYYNTLKRAEIISDHLQEIGIPAENITMSSVGYNYPAVKTSGISLSEDSLFYWNKRVDIRMYDASGEPVNWNEIIKLETIPLQSRDEAFELYQMITSDLYFSVHLASSNRMFKNALLRIYSDIHLQKNHPDSDIEYYVGLYSRFEDARELQNQIQEKSPDLKTKISAFYKGKKMSPEQIRLLGPKFRQLKLLQGEN